MSYLKIKRVLVTGASGFIGRHLCALLLQNGYLVRALTRTGKSATFASNPNIEHFEGDLTEPAELSKACENIDVIVHLAGLAHTVNVSDEELQIANVSNTQRLLSAAVKQKVSRFILMSSSLAFAVDDRDRTLTSYGNSKLAAERLVLAEDRIGSLEGVVLRPVNVYGRGMRGNIATLASLISRRIAPALPRLQSKISLVSVGDVSAAVLLSLESKRAKGQTYLLTDGQEYQINDIEAAIYLALGRQLPSWRPPVLLLYVSLEFAQILGRILRLFGVSHLAFEGLSYRTYETLVQDNLFCNQKIKDELDFRPQTTFYSSLPKILEGINVKNSNLTDA